MEKKDLRGIFYPESVAILGANKVAGTVPNDILTSILKANFQGAIYPVNPREKFINGIKAYKYILDIPDPVDLAILVFPSSVCHMALEQCGKKGVKSAIIISAGFKEVGGQGLEREKQIKDIAKKYGISFIGPNCLGVINTDPTSLLNASFARKMPIEGEIGFLSQSGALCTAVLDYARAKEIGFSKFVSFGNKADISEIDLLYYLADDPKTKVILLYLEEVSNGRALMKTAQDVIAKTGKPILAIKSGRTSEGASAAASHTGSLAGSDEICDAAFSQAGIIRCDNIEEMFNYAIAFTYQPMPKGKRLAIVTNAGGPGVLATDAAIKAGLEMAKFTDETTSVFKKSLPKTANIKNPVDVIGDARADRYNVAISGSLNDENVDGVNVILTPQSMTDIKTIANEITVIASKFEKPVYASFMGEADVAEGIKLLQKRGIPHYILPESMCNSFAVVNQFREWLERPIEDKEEIVEGNQKAVKDLFEKYRDYSVLTEDKATQILKAYGIPVPENGLAESEDEAVKLAERIGYPVVMKIMAEGVYHKFDIGGVVLNIENQESARKAYNDIIDNTNKECPDASIYGVLVTQMLKNGEEVILGLKKDNSFGPVIMFGLGGVFVEVFKDVSFMVAPVSKNNARVMVNSIKSIPLLRGARGRSKKDIESIITCIQRLSKLAIDFPEIQELDINPLIVLDEGKGCFVGDAKIIK